MSSLRVGVNDIMRKLAAIALFLEDGRRHETKDMRRTETIDDKTDEETDIIFGSFGGCEKRFAPQIKINLHYFRKNNDF